MTARLTHRRRAVHANARVGGRVIPATDARMRRVLVPLLASLALAAAPAHAVVRDGGFGNDRLTGTRGPDRLAGGSGNDVLRGDDGDDRLDGGTGNDRVAGGPGDDWLDGGDGDDVVRGQAGDDFILEAGYGNDK